ncbi:hypothetical protein ATCC51561_369 [Campylobacter concisus ATCC 51561]|nr:hypothetical protein ATCC51561_369 [Campylobacter concisus ATCC 51561]
MPLSKNSNLIFKFITQATFKWREIEWLLSKREKNENKIASCHCALCRF